MAIINSLTRTIDYLTVRLRDLEAEKALAVVVKEMTKVVEDKPVKKDKPVKVKKEKKLSGSSGSKRLRQDGQIDGRTAEGRALKLKLAQEELEEDGERVDEILVDLSKGK